MRSVLPLVLALCVSCVPQFLPLGNVDAGRAWRAAWVHESGEAIVVGGSATTGAAVSIKQGKTADLTLPDGGMLRCVTGLTRATVTMGGDGGRVLRASGTGFTALDSPTTATLRGCWTSPDGTTWLVGGNDTDGVPVVLRVRDDVVTEVPTGLSDPGLHAFTAIWGGADDDVWIVGQAGVIAHFDGTVLKRQVIDTTANFSGISGSFGNPVIAVGSDDRGVVAAEFTEGEWKSRQLKGLPALHGVWVRLDGFGYVVGDGGLLGVIDPSGLGVTRIPDTGDVTFFGVSALLGQGAYVVGGKADGTGGVIWHRDAVMNE